MLDNAYCRWSMQSSKRNTRTTAIKGRQAAALHTLHVYKQTGTQHNAHTIQGVGQQHKTGKNADQQAPFSRSHTLMHAHRTTATGP